MSLRLRSILAFGLAALGAVTHLTAYEPDGYPIWPDGTITMHLQMGSSPALMDGSTWNTSLDEALKQWNRNLGRVQFASVIGSTTPVSRSNGRNNVVFRKDVYGEAFGENVLAVTLSSTSGGHRSESDVIFNQAEKWDSYRGGLLYSKFDIRRVALHEFGHVLGLTHPDQAGQYVTAVMNSTTSEVDALQTDDQNGAAALYGPGIDNPVPPPTISTQPYSQSVTEGQIASFYIYAYGSSPLTYQWRKDGTAISGATQSEYRIEAVRASDAGSYTVVVTNPGGSVTSSAVTLTVEAAVPPSFRYSYPPAQSVEIGSIANIFGPHVDGSWPLTYQWFKDDVAITGATSSSLTINPVTVNSGGNYVLEARNAAGTARSEAFTLTLLPQSLPPASWVFHHQNAIIGQSLSLLTSPYDPPRNQFQWYKDGQPIPGATQSMLIFPALSASDAGEYVAVLTNAAGATASLPLTLQPQPPADSAASRWLSVRQHGDTFYFLYATPARIERYHNTSGWLSPFTLSSTPTTFAVHESGIYVALNGSIHRFALDGSAQTQLAATPNPISELLVWNDFLIASSHSASVFTTLRRDTGALVTTSATYFSLPRGLSLAPNRGRIFGWSINGLPSDIAYRELNADGTYGPGSLSPRQVAYPTAFRTWVNTTESQVADDSGTVFDAADLSVVGSLGGDVTDLAAYDTGWVALRHDVLVHYDQGLSEVGQTHLAQAGSALFVQGNEAIIFCAPTATSQEVAVIRQPLTSLPPASAGEPAVPAKAVLAVDDLFTDSNGVVHLLNRATRNLFRWSTAERRFLESIPLRGSPSQLAYSEALNRVFLGYKRLTTYVDLNSSITSETPFVSAYADDFQLAIAGEHLLLTNGSSSSLSYFSYDAAGARVDQWSGASAIRSSAWNPANRRFYFLDGSRLEAVEVKTDGTFGQVSELSYASYGLTIPIRVDPTGANLLLLGTAKFHDATSLQPHNALANPVTDAVWVDGTLLTVRNLAMVAQLERWSPTNYALEASQSLPGRVLRIFALDSHRFVAVGLRDGYLFFAVIGSDLSIQSIDENKPFTRLANLASRAKVGTGDKVLISGFVIGGSGKKSLLLRAVGPTLADYGVTGELANPRLTVFNSQGAPIDTNDDWSSAPNFNELVSRSKAIGAATLRSASRDAALLTSLDPGLYTVHVTGAADSTGVGLVELFDADNRDSTARLVNISTRAQVGTGDGILIPGLVVDGDAPVTVLIRAVGPSLVKHGVTDALADPQLQVLDRDAKVIASNDDWWSGTDLDLLNFTSKQVGAGTLDSYSKDAAVVVTLPPGVYTVHVKGVNDTTGVALVEVFYASP